LSVAIARASMQIEMTCAGEPVSAYGTFRTSHPHRQMSALGAKADMTLTLDNVR
jgi:hypothetical protein